MHTADLLYEIHRLLLAGELSQREIAAHLSVSRGTVSAVANGRRSLEGREARRGYSPLTPIGTPVRCPQCGHRVYLPCIICRIREHRDRNQVLQILARQRASGAARKVSQRHKSAPQGAA
jgi:transcriptional regulator with XRE-family HTH domain